MKQVIRATVAALMLVAVLLPAGPIAYAEEYVCRNKLGALRVDNLRVPQKTSCLLEGTQVQGTVKVEKGATLRARQVNIIGNIQAEGAAVVHVTEGSAVGGSIQIKQGGAATIDRVQISGDLQWDENRGLLIATRNQVGGSIQVFKNSGGVAITDNTIDGNLQCKENDPIPTVGNNLVQGGTQDQCIPPGGDDDGEAFVPTQLVVKLNPTSGATIDTINSTYGTSTIQPLLNSGNIYLLQTPATIDTLALVEQMSGDTRLSYAEPNFYGELPEGGSRSKWAWAGSDPAPVGTQYATTMLRLATAHTLSRGGQVIVAVLDTGVQLNHPMLAPRLTAARYDFVDDDPVPDEDFANLDGNGDGLVDESAGHGTHVAAIISLAAPDAQIMPLRVLDANGRGNVFLIAEAIAYATQHGARVINLSLGTHVRSRLLGEAINTATTTYNALVVAAAGNLDSTALMFPAAEEAALGVTAVNQYRMKADFANYGPWVDIAAPGDEIYSAFPIDGYLYWSGTSMATPFIAGQAALLASRYPALTARDLRRCILTTAQPLTPELGAGLTDFVTSLTLAGTNCGTGSTTGSATNSTAYTGDDAAIQLYLPLVAQ